MIARFQIPTAASHPGFSRPGSDLCLQSGQTEGKAADNRRNAGSFAASCLWSQEC